MGYTVVSLLEVLSTMTLNHWYFVRQVIKWALTHWGWDKMAAIFQMTFLNTFSWMKMYDFWSRFHWNLFLRVKLTIFQHWFIWWLGTDQATSHYLNQWYLVHRCIYALSGLNELMGHFYHGHKTKIYRVLLLSRTLLKGKMVIVYMLVERHDSGNCEDTFVVVTISITLKCSWLLSRMNFNSLVSRSISYLRIGSDFKI